MDKLHSSDFLYRVSELEPGSALASKARKIHSTPKGYLSDADIKETIAEIKTYYMDRARGPNLFQALFIPQQLYHGYLSLVEAVKTRNTRALLDARLKIVNTAVNSAYAVCSLIAFVGQMGVLFSYSTAKTLALVSPITGLVASTLAAGIEVKNTRRQIVFIKKCNKDLRLLKYSPMVRSDYLFLSKYLGDPTGLSMNTLAKLTNRVTPWYAEKMALNLPKLLHVIKTTHNPKVRQKALDKAQEMLENAKIQAQKKLRAQVLTLVATSLAITGFIAILASFPVFVAPALFATSLLIGVANHIQYNGTYKHVGWSFKLSETPPAWIFTLGRKIYEFSNCGFRHYLEADKST